ncbi:hypothetical protein AMATHDRAFT_53419 [Amanita thiersii Skay4041]|uniref:Uncharacterized protein n=1 Tax=Amanita thiersii Skay4041 TaxID=703135 RepID=A0A2A9NZ97_9AGAR|nr:hypothetical protein AMATHDRAFT_53419 [Amanita thiersii Skay4041]
MECSDLYNGQQKRSTPIDIPQWQRPNAAKSTLFPSQRSLSPDMIFEMSPVISHIPSPQDTFIYPVSRNIHDQEEPFLYHFPILSNRSINIKNKAHNRPIKHQEIPISHVFPPPKSTHRCHRKPPEHVGENISRPIIRKGFVVKNPITRIVGFSPILKASIGDSKSKGELPRFECLSPIVEKHRISPEEKSCQQDGEAASVEVEPNVFLFKKYLHHRTEYRDHLRSHGFPHPYKPGY